MVSSHLTVLEESASKYAHSPVFKDVQARTVTGRVKEWRSISYMEFHRDVSSYARSWKSVLCHDGVYPGSIVGLWLGGFSYSDVLHIYGISRAGYIVQLLSLQLPNPSMVYELLRHAGARALIYDASFSSVEKDRSLAFYSIHNIVELHDVNVPLPDLRRARPDDIVFVFHTSGSTSGSPKLVPCTYRWLETVIQKSRLICQPLSPLRQDVTVSIGSMCHIAQSFMLLGTLQHGSCMIQPTTISFSTHEFVDMIITGGINRLNEFATFLSNHIRQARQNPKVAELLSNLDDVLCTGLPLPLEEEQWAYDNGVKLRNLFGSTEVGGMLLSGGHPRNRGLFQVLDGYAYQFIPVDPHHNEIKHESTSRLVELIIPANSPDCPHPSLRSSDGYFHTGDLFEEAAPGFYRFRGRDDDWIKTVNSLRCDTKSIEDNARVMCKDTISECVVVGSERPSPVMFVEPLGDVDPERLKKDIVRKTRQFHARRYIHERITSTKMIIVVPKATLPRTGTKRNIRRQAVEEAYKAELDRIFGNTGSHC